MNEFDLARDAADAAGIVVEKMLDSGKVEHDAATDLVYMPRETLAHAIACALLTWEHRHLLRMQ